MEIFEDCWWVRNLHSQYLWKWKIYYKHSNSKMELWHTFYQHNFRWQDLEAWIDRCFSILTFSLIKNRIFIKKRYFSRKLFRMIDDDWIEIDFAKEKKVAFINFYLKIKKRAENNKFPRTFRPPCITRTQHNYFLC